jgi:glycosyltransferase involved in cell wall biosynthesis
MKISFPYTHGGSGSDVWTISLAHALKKAGVETEVVEYPKPYQVFPYLLKLTNYKTDADIIHTNSWTGLGFIDNSKPHVTTEHHVVHDKLLSPYKNFAQKVFHKAVYRYEKKSVEKADNITVPSLYTQKKLQDSFNKSSQLIYNGVDTNTFLPLNKKLNKDPSNNQKIKLFFVGNLSKRKGADLLPKIMRALGNNFILYTTLTVKGTMLDKLDNIVSIGKLNLDELVQWYNYCDIFLSPSRMEGFGLTICEAMACGKPVVTTNITAMPELIIPNKGGELCHLDDVIDFVDKIKGLADSPTLIRSAGEFNRERVEQFFSLDMMTKKYINMYEKLLNQPLL